MPVMPPAHRPFGRSVKGDAAFYERARGSAHERGYDGAWRKARAVYLSEHPLCEYCALGGVTAAAELVDHLYPHRGDKVLFWARWNWVSSCRGCHSGMKQAVECAGKGAIDALAARLKRTCGVPLSVPREG